MDGIRSDIFFPNLVSTLNASMFPKLYLVGLFYDLKEPAISVNAAVSFAAGSAFI